MQQRDNRDQVHLLVALRCEGYNILYPSFMYIREQFIRPIYTCSVCGRDLSIIICLIDHSRKPIATVRYLATFNYYSTIREFLYVICLTTYKVVGLSYTL